MLRLEDINLYKILVNRSTSNSKYYASFLMPLEHDMDVLLQYIKKEYPDFPDHGLQHSLRILQYIGKILSDDQIDQISDLEIFIFIFASLFHDSGMVLYNNMGKDKVRAEHHRYAKKVISMYFDECLKNLSDSERIKEAVIFVSYAHGLQLSDLTSDRCFFKVDTISYDDVRYRLLAFLLRIGDLMDLEGERANNFRMILYSDSFSELALDHNSRHQNVKLYNYSSAVISIEVEAKNIQQYKIWREWFTYLENDILSANTYLKEIKINFPLPKTKIIAPNGDEFDIQELRFEIDERGGIWEIISKSVYTNELDFVRELIQNAIDATLKRIYINDAIELFNSSPRSWEAYTIAEPIWVCYSEKRGKLYVIDQGIGMNKDDLQCFLFKVSSTGYVDCSKRKFDFPGIAQYGIGFVSCLINAKKIQIYTSKRNDSKIQLVTMESDLNVAFIQNTENSSEFIGTIVELDLKHIYPKRDIKAYLEKTFYCTSVKIKYSDLDKVEAVAINLSNKDKFETALEKPFVLSEFISKTTQKATEIVGPLRGEKNKAVEYEKRLKSFINFIKNNNYDTLRESTLAIYNEQANNLKQDLPLEKLQNDFPNIILKTSQMVNDKHFFEHVKRTIDDFDAKIIIEKEKYDMQIDKFMLDEYVVSSKQIVIGDEWRYFAAFFDSDFNVFDIQYSLDPIELSGKTGIILFKCSGQDYQHGIEFVAINGFLFKDGKIWSRLARFEGYKEYKGPSITQDSFVIGLEEDCADIRERVQEYFYDLNYTYENIMEDFENSYTEHKQIDAEYDVIHISNNNFIRSNNKNVFELRKYYNEEFGENYDLYNEMVGMNKKGTNGKIEAGLFELERCIIAERNSYYQDGIAISSKLNNLFPIGLFRIVCNCTADARMKLNVTRHNLSEIRSDIEDWINNTGVKIQEMLVDSLVDMLREESLYIDISDLIGEYENSDYFSQLCYKSLCDILRKRFK